MITQETSDLTKHVINGKTGCLGEGMITRVCFYVAKPILTVRKEDVEEMKRYVRSANSAFDWHSHIMDF